MEGRGVRYEGRVVSRHCEGRCGGIGHVEATGWKRYQRVRAL